MRRLLPTAILTTAILTVALIAPAAATAAPTTAAPTTAAPVQNGDRVGRVVAGLRQSPLFVDPDVSYLLNATQRAALVQRIRGVGVPLYLAVVPVGSQDESAGDAGYLAYLLHQRLGRSGIYLVCDQRGNLDWTAYHVPRDDTLGYDQAFSDKPVPTKLNDVVDAFTHAPSAAPSDPAPPRAPEPALSQRKTTATGLAGQFTKAFFPSLIFSGFLLALLWVLGAGALRLVRAVHEPHPRTLGARRLRRTARAELVRLAREIGRAETGNPGYPKAMADYDAAKLLFDEKQDPGSRFGVVVLSLEGQDALRHETADPEPRCVVNPFHGPARHRVRQRLPGLREARRPVCDACEQPTLRVRPLTLEVDGRRCPYYSAPGLWEKLRGRSADLPGHVLEYLGVE